MHSWHCLLTGGITMRGSHCHSAPHADEQFAAILEDADSQVLCLVSSTDLPSAPWRSVFFCMYFFPLFLAVSFSSPSDSAPTRSGMHWSGRSECCAQLGHPHWVPRTDIRPQEVGQWHVRLFLSRRKELPCIFLWVERRCGIPCTLVRVETRLEKPTWLAM